MLATLRPKLVAGIAVITTATSVLALWPREPRPVSMRLDEPGISMRRAVMPALPAMRTRAVPCLDGSIELIADGDHAVLCSNDGCLALDLDHQLVPVARPMGPPAMTAQPIPDVRTERGKTAVCFGSDCKPIGPNLREVLAGNSSDDVSATTDLAAVVVNGSAWSVKRDAPLHLARFRPEDMIGSVQAAGKLLLADQTACAGPCGNETVYDSRGKVRIDGLDGEAEIVNLGDDLILVGVHGSIDEIDATTGERIASTSVETLPLWNYGPHPVALGANGRDDRRIAVLREGMAQDSVTLSVFEIDNSQRLFMLVGEVNVPSCTVR